MNHRNKILPTTAALLSLMLAACGSSSSNRDFAGRLFVAPGRYLNYDCAQLEGRAKGVAARRKVLEGLMAKAETTSDGRIVSAMAYQAEYTETGGDLDELRADAAEKQCKIAVLQAPNSSR